MKINPKNLENTLKILMGRVKQTAYAAGGNIVTNLKTILTQVSNEYVKITKENRSIQVLNKYTNTEDGIIFCIALIMLCNSIIPEYGKDSAIEIINNASKTPPLVPQLNPKVVQKTVKESKMKKIKKINENSIDLKFLPSDVIAWLFDKNDAQVNTAKDIGIACHEVGNPIVSGFALKGDVNILVLKPKYGDGRFHVYPDGARSFWAKNGAFPKLLDGHEDVERLIGVKPETDVATIEEPEMDSFANPRELHPQEYEAEIVEPEDEFMVQSNPGGLMKIKGLSFNDII